MEFIRKYQVVLVGMIVGASIVYTAAYLTTERRLSQLQLSLDETIESAYVETIALAMEIGQGGQGSAVAAIIADCSEAERDIFEGHLVRLDQGLSPADLEELDLLFGRCAPVRSVRRSLMLMDLSRHIENLESLILQRKQIGSFTNYDENLDTLMNLAVHEKKITEISFDMVYLQREIIDALLAGESVHSERAAEFRERGVALRTELVSEAEAAIQLRQALRPS